MTDYRAAIAGELARVRAAAADPHLYAPNGQPWCHFGRGLWCVNGDDCRNPRHRRVVKR